MTKKELENCKKINLNWLMKQIKKSTEGSGKITWTYGESVSSIGYQINTSVDAKFLRLYYTQTSKFTETKQSFDYKIFLEQIQCRYGGYRYYFICPNCTNKVSVVYLDTTIFCCRTCNNLTYKSKNVNRRNNLFQSFDLMFKNDDLLPCIKKWTYKGNLTQKAKRYLKNKEKFMRVSRLIKN
jgi:hypothetical protein